MTLGTYLAKSSNAVNRHENTIGRGRRRSRRRRRGRGRGRGKGRGGEEGSRKNHTNLEAFHRLDNKPVQTTPSGGTNVIVLSSEKNVYCFFWEHDFGE